MNTFRNNVFLTGIAAGEPKIIELGNNRRIARLSMAIDESYKNKTGEFVKQTNWFNLVCWNKNVELVENVVSKGSKFSIEGKLSANSYTDNKGEKKYGIDIVVHKVEVADE